MINIFKSLKKKREPEKVVIVNYSINEETKKFSDDLNKILDECDEEKLGENLTGILVKYDIKVPWDNGTDYSFEAFDEFMSDPNKHLTFE